MTRRPVDRMDPDVARVLTHHCRTAVRADWTPPLPRIPLRHRIGERIATVLVCPDCLLPRVHPFHWLHR